jgi:hypothetical protein
MFKRVTLLTLITFTVLLAYQIAFAYPSCVEAIIDCQNAGRCQYELHPWEYPDIFYLECFPLDPKANEENTEHTLGPECYFWCTKCTA